MFNPIRTLARQMLASMFVVGGWDALRHPEAKAPKAADVVEPLRDRVSALDALDTPEIVRANAAVQVAGGVLLALGKAPRLTSAVLATSLVPTTLAGHRFWEEDDPSARANQRTHFFKNVAMLGGLLLGALDTEGRPGLAWRARHAAERAKRGAEHQADVFDLRRELVKEKLTPDVADAKRLVSALRS